MSGSALARRYRRRYALGPEVAITRREAIEDAAYAEEEALGNTPIEREEVALAAIYCALGKLAERQGVDMREVARRVADLESIRPQSYREPTQEEKERLDDEETRREFAPLLAEAKARLRRSASRDSKERND